MKQRNEKPLKLRFNRLVVLLLLATSSVSLAADRQRVRELGQRFICICSCNQLLTGCNHINCPSSGPMLAELADQIDQGKNDESIVSYFVQKYGMTVLSAPPASGFNLTAWIMPFAALVIGAILVAYFARRFRARWAAPAADVDSTKYQARVEEELKKYTPED